MRCVKKLFFIILATAISGIAMPEITFYRAVEASDLAQGALWRFNQCRGIGHTTFQLRGGTLPSSYRHPSEIFFANAMVSGDGMMTFDSCK